MTFVYDDRVRESSTFTGTGNVTLDGAPDSTHQAFGDVMADNDTTDISIFGGGDFEDCPATYDADTNVLIRGTPYSSSNAGAAVSFGVGAKIVIMNLPASKAQPLGNGKLVRVDAAQSFSTTEQSQARANIGLGERNVLINGDFEIWQRRGSSAGSTLSSPAATRTFAADRIYVNPAGAAVTQARSAVIPTGARSRYSNQVVGATSVTTVLIGQRVAADNIPALKRTVTAQIWVYNGTGGAFTPNLLIGTPGASNDFTTVTNRLTQALQSCVDASWTQVSHTVDISAYTNIDNGLQFEIQIPSGSLNSGAKDVKFAEMKLAGGLGVSVFDRLLRSEIIRQCEPYYTKSFPMETLPAQAAGTDGCEIAISASTAAGGGGLSVRFRSEMVKAPGVTTYNPTAADANWRNSASANIAANVAEVMQKGFRATINGTTTDANLHFIHYSADAEL